jgi:hypothetical protein
LYERKAEGRQGRREESWEMREHEEWSREERWRRERRGERIIVLGQVNKE